MRTASPHSQSHEKAADKKAEAAKLEAERLAKISAEADRLKKAQADQLAKDEEEARLARARDAGDAMEVTSAQELAEKRNWLTPEQTEKRLDNLFKESGAVNAKECELLMNSIVRGSAINFGVNSSVIDPSSFTILQKVQSVADHCSNTVIRIEGHTDSDGSEGYNLELSKRRARAVISHLIDLGVPANRLDAKGYGEVKPVASNDNSNGKSLNRRIEFVVFEN